MIRNLKSERLIIEKMIVENYTKNTIKMEGLKVETVHSEYDLISAFFFRVDRIWYI